MANFVVKYSIMTQEMVDIFCENFYIPAEVHPTALGRDKTITQFPADKVGVYSRLFDVCGYRIPFTKFFMAVLKYFRVHISQLSPFGAAWVSHFEVLTRVLDLSPSVTVFHAFYTRTYSDRGVLEKDLAPHLTARQEQTVKLLKSHKAPFCRYPECFLCLVGLSPYYPFEENSYPDFERPNRTNMGLLDFIKTADPRKVREVEVQKGDDQVTLLESTRHCFMPLVIPAAGGSSSAAATEILAPIERGQEDVAEENAYLELADPDEDTAMVRQSKEEVVTEQSKKVKKRRLQKQGNVLPAKKLRADHPALASGTGGKTLAGLEQIRPTGSRFPDLEQLVIPSVAPPSQESKGFLDSFARMNLRICTNVESSSALAIPVDTTTAATTSTGAAATTKLETNVDPDLVGPFHPEESEGSDDSFYAPTTLDPSVAKRCEPWAARQVCLGAEVRSLAEHELELKEKLRVKYAARGRLLEEKNLEILELKSKLVEKEAKATEVIRLRDQVSSLSEDKSSLTAEVSALKVTITQKDHDISLFDSRATHLESALNDAQVACTEAGTKITSLASERDRLVSEVSSLHVGFKDFKEKMEVQQEEQAKELYNRVAELEAHVMDVSGRQEGEFYPTYLTLLARRRWLLTHGIQLAILKCLKSSEYQGILRHALGRAMDFDMQEGLEAGHEHGVAGRSLFMVDAYNPEAARASYVNAVKAVEDTSFPLVDLLKSKKDARMDEVLDCFLLDGPLAGLPCSC
ncbi:hypothetical protein Tco_0178557 [Tanacetum coccineum]